jgi:2-polyprenyl-3-methyl-5-hydroxy-6-metoxy-1,4-benzoquinol methylase
LGLQLKNLKEKIIELLALLNKAWHRLRQKERIIRNPELKKIYTDFFKFHEDEKVSMLHRVDLYSPGPPITVPSSEMLDLIDMHAGETILDIGCGHGVYGKELLKKGYRYTGIEANEKYVKEARKHVDALCMRAEKLEFPDKSFDTIILLEVLEHLEDPYTALSEIVRVTRKNLVVSVPNISPLVECVEYNVVMHHFLESTHVNFFTKNMLGRFLKQYFPYVILKEFGQFFNLSGSKLYYQLAAVASFKEIKK